MQQQFAAFFSGGGADPNALYVVWGGANDFFQGIRDSTLGPGTVSTAVSNLSGYVSALVGAGATQFLVPNLPDLSLTPAAGGVAALLEAGTPGAGAAFLAALSGLSDAFNANLELAMDAIEAGAPGVDVDLLRVDQLVDALVANPAAFGLSDVTHPCLAGGSVCADPSQFLFWDAAHPTAGVHRLLGEQMFLAAVPAPRTLALIVLGLPLLGLALRRRG
jgi:phospholipase/lecithinase/hemolysin